MRSRGKCERRFERIVVLVTMSAAAPWATGQERTGELQTLQVGREFTVAYPRTWSVAETPLRNVDVLVNVPAGQQTAPGGIANIKIRTEERRDAGEALLRLHQIATGYGAPATAYQEIDGFPGVQFTRREARSQPSQGMRFADPTVVRITTAAAVGDRLVRLEAYLPSKASPEMIAEAEAISRNLAFAKAPDEAQTEEALNELRRIHEDAPAAAEAAGPKADAAPLPVGPPADLAEGEASDLPEPGLNVRVANFTNFPDSEIEVAASTNGRNIVIGTNNRYLFSNDGGQNWGVSNGIGGNDPSVAFGVSGTFYAANIRGNCQPADAAGPFGYTCTGMWTSNDNGQNFNIFANAVVCPNPDPSGAVVVPGSCFPDQEHIVADRFNAAPGGDQVYSTWRNFDATDQDPAIVCSQDGGANWTAPVDVGTGAFPRIGIGQDGFVYVVWFDGGNYLIRRYSSCANGLVPQFGPTVVTARTPVTCPFPGHDRCDQNPSSQTVAVDDTNPSHIYFAFATSTAADNDNVLVRDSLDGGATWPGGRVVRINQAVTSPRIMPWVCSTGGKAFVTWYDRRSATPCPAPPCPGTNNDLTNFYGGSAGLDHNGNLVALGDFQISEVGDPWCGTGAATDWPCGTRGAPGASESCSVQPQLAGRCTDTNGNFTGVQCDFSNCGGVGMGVGANCECNIGANETCNGGNGCPKYGDYNGSTCVAGRLFAAWASATSPARITPASTTIDAFFSLMVVGDVPQIQVPASVAAGDVCVGESQAVTLNVCNNGNANLDVGPITSSNPQFVVTTPSGGFPVIISPDFCFPFEVVFTPTSTGDKSATLTINSNDPSFPTLEVDATGTGTEPNIVTVIADNGDFGDVCRGDFKDLDLTISNSGNCPLVIDDITSSSAEFQTASVMVFPLVVGPKISTAVPIRFAPTTLGVKNATITVVSNDPDTPNKVVNVSGNVPPGDIRVSGSTDFGVVCAETLAEKVVDVCNFGKCDLSVTNVSVDCPDFTIINNPFPGVVSKDFCVDVTIRFTPTACSDDPIVCTLTINSDDPDTPEVTLELTGRTPCASIDVPGDLPFLPTVIQSVDVCETLLPFPVSNTGECNLHITAFEITADLLGEFDIFALPSFPIILEPGHVAGEGDLAVVFAPEVIDRDRLGEVSVTWVDDPVTGAEMTASRDLCGEGVLTGARVLVIQGTTPLDEVKSIKLLRINANRRNNILRTVDVAKDLPLQTIMPAAPCPKIMFHREYGTVDNPFQLLPGSYEVSVMARIEGKNRRKNVGFRVGSCGFNPNIVVNFE